MSEYVVRLRDGSYFGGEDEISVDESEALRMTRETARVVEKVTGGALQKI